MSWLIQNLIINREYIKESLDDVYKEHLLTFEGIEKRLASDNLLNKDELKLFNSFVKNRSVKKTAVELKISLPTAAKRINFVCNKLADLCGYEFTDEGYLEYMKNKYKLTNQEVNTMKKYMKSKFKYRLMRSQYE